MIQRRCRFGLSPGPRFNIVVTEKMRRKELQGNRPLEIGVFGLLDHTHPTLTKLLGNAVVRDRCAYHGRTAPSRSRLSLFPG
jgi:hypothetical protein